MQPELGLLHSSVAMCKQRRLMIYYMASCRKCMAQREWEQDGEGVVCVCVCVSTKCQQRRISINISIMAQSWQQSGRRPLSQIERRQRKAKLRNL